MRAVRLSVVTAAVLLGTIPSACTPPSEDGPDAGTAAPAFPAPLIGGTASTDALANAPAQCGQAAHTWVKQGVGALVSLGEVTHNTASILEGLAVTGGLMLPRAPLWDARTATFTYTTQDRGMVLEATGVVAWPYGQPDDAPPAPVLLLLHGTQGFTDGCSLDRDPGSKLLASYFASLGYVVVGPDYLGLKASGTTGFPHPYLAGIPTAMASLDAVRAVGSLSGQAMLDGVKVEPRLVVFGGSQGGHAALWVDRLQPYYARELVLAGVVATVPPADLLSEGVRALTQVVPATGNTLAMLGVTSPWYGLNDFSLVLKPPYDVDVPAALAASCDPSGDIPENAPLDQVFQPLLLDAAAAGTLGDVPGYGCIFRENGLTTTSIARQQPARASFGILFITGEADTLVTTPIQRAAFTQLCNAGMPLRYLECAGASHTRATVWSLEELVDFAEARRAGEPFTADCTPGAPVRCSGTPAMP